MNNAAKELGHAFDFVEDGPVLIDRPSVLIHLIRQLYLDASGPTYPRSKLESPILHSKHEKALRGSISAVKGK